MAPKSHLDGREVERGSGCGWEGAVCVLGGGRGGRAPGRTCTGTGTSTHTQNACGWKGGVERRGAGHRAADNAQARIHACGSDPGGSSERGAGTRPLTRTHTTRADGAASHPRLKIHSLPRSLTHSPKQEELDARDESTPDGMSRDVTRARPLVALIVRHTLTVTSRAARGQVWYQWVCEERRQGRSQ